MELIREEGAFSLGREKGVLILREHGFGIMSDSGNLKEFGAKFARCMTGHVLVVGLGIGLHLPALLANPEVRNLTVLEKHPEVVSLYQDSPYRVDGIPVVVGDFFDHHGKYDSVWVDLFSRPPTYAERTRAEEYAQRLTQGPIVMWPFGVI